MRRFVFGRGSAVCRLPADCDHPSGNVNVNLGRVTIHWIEKKRRQEESESTASRSHIDIGQSPGNLTDVFFKAHNSLVSRFPLSLPS